MQAHVQELIGVGQNGRKRGIQFHAHRNALRFQLRREHAQAGSEHAVEVNSIQPDWILNLPRSVTPLRGEEFIARPEDQSAYSLEDLGEAVESLAANYERLSDYLREVGLVGAAVS